MTQRLGESVPERELDWWHREHPTFTALSGFFSGLLFVGVVPALFMTGLRAAFSARVAESLFPFVLAFLAFPVGLVLTRSTRRFGWYMWLGIISTLVVVLGVTTLVLWVLAGREA